MNLNQVVKLSQQALQEEVLDVFYWKEGKSWNYDVPYPLTREKIFNMARKAEKGIFFSLGHNNCADYTQKGIKNRIKNSYKDYEDKLKVNRNIGADILNNYLEQVEEVN
jgi:hypothetical protein